MENEDKIELEIKRIVSSQMIDLFKPNLKVQYFDILEYYASHGLRMIYNFAVKEELIAKYPSDWWQSFKERWLPKWLQRRFPVRYTEVIAQHKFPHWQKELGKEYVQIIYKDTAPQATSIL